MAGLDDVRAALTLAKDKALAGAGPQRRADLVNILSKAEADLRARLDTIEGAGGAGPESFGAAQTRALLVQVRHVLRALNVDLRDLVVDHAVAAAEKSTDATVEYLQTLDDHYRGVGTTPLDIDTPDVMSRVLRGTESSVLHRLANGPENDPKRLGILQRYGAATLEHFEEVIRVGKASGKSWEDMRDDLRERSTFLKDKPMYWAERILRTESAAAYNAAGLHAIQAADERTGDMVKILVAIFDDRTASDSYATHGEIRRPNEPFDTWHGKMMHPPDRPNDRGTVVPHRIAWPLSPNLAWKTDEEVEARWADYEGRKGEMPERPVMTTIPLSAFGKKWKAPEDEAPVVRPEEPTEGTKPPVDEARPFEVTEEEPRPVGPDGLPIEPEEGLPVDEVAAPDEEGPDLAPPTAVEQAAAAEAEAAADADTAAEEDAANAPADDPRVALRPDDQADPIAPEDVGETFRAALGDGWAHNIDQTAVPNVARGVLAADGIFSRDVDLQRPGRNAFVFIDAKANAFHHWDGTVSITPDMHERARRGADGLRRKASNIAPDDVDAVKAIIHEEIHGASPIRGSAYWDSESVGGRVVEEVVTEINARRLTRELFASQCPAQNLRILSMPRHHNGRFLIGVNPSYELQIQDVCDAVLDVGVPGDEVVPLLETAARNARRFAAVTHDQLLATPEQVVDQFLGFLEVTDVQRVALRTKLIAMEWRD